MPDPAAQPRPPVEQYGPASTSPHYSPPDPVERRSALHRHRKILVIGLVVAVLAWAGGLWAFLAHRDEGPDPRAAYCAKLIAVTEAKQGGDLRGLFVVVNPHLYGLQQTAALAPAEVADDWATIEDILQRVVVDATEEVTPALDTRLSTSVQRVSADSNDKCGTEFAL